MTSRIIIIATAIAATVTLLSSAGTSEARGLRTAGNAATVAGTTVTMKQLNTAATTARAPQAVGAWRYQKRGCHRPGC